MSISPPLQVSFLSPTKKKSWRSRKREYSTMIFSRSRIWMAVNSMPAGGARAEGMSSWLRLLASSPRTTMVFVHPFTIEDLRRKYSFLNAQLLLYFINIE